MKLKFKKQAYQTNAVEAVANCFAGQPAKAGIEYRVDPDRAKTGKKLSKHVYDYVFTDSSVEQAFVKELDASSEVVVYAKLPSGFSIPTPVGDYNPDWAISFKEDSVKHVYFIAETKGSLSSMDLRKIEDCKIACAKKFFAKITSDQVQYEVVTSYAKLMELVK